MIRAGALAALAGLAAAGGAAAQDAPEDRRYGCRSGIDLAVAAVPGASGTVLVMAPEGRQVILLPEGPQAGGATLHVEQPARPMPTGLYLWRERPRTAEESAAPGTLAWVAERGWRSEAGERVVDRCRRLGG